MVSVEGRFSQVCTKLYLSWCNNSRVQYNTLIEQTVRLVSTDQSFGIAQKVVEPVSFLSKELTVSV